MANADNQLSEAVGDAVPNQLHNSDIAMPIPSELLQLAKVQFQNVMIVPIQRVFDRFYLISEIVSLA